MLQVRALMEYKPREEGWGGRMRREYKLKEMQRRSVGKEAKRTEESKNVFTDISSFLFPAVTELIKPPSGMAP